MTRKFPTILGTLSALFAILPAHGQSMDVVSKAEIAAELAGKFITVEGSSHGDRRELYFSADGKFFSSTAWGGVEGTYEITDGKICAKISTTASMACRQVVRDSRGGLAFLTSNGSLARWTVLGSSPTAQAETK
ncbi:hypothetical protein [Vineibacter terrae]|uniref:hypothetical protein n=1 Tax=Vineibacter terrae TaxID=2586908 RepID=UPI002E36E12A|nr:hypothetical protein [Vineibacter terrae]HEX2888142.1 hypothetical protein [Vineibacter terrae]